MISVIIPTYRNRGGLLRSIDSVLNQRCDFEVEVIVVDDNDPNSEERSQTEELMTRFVKDFRVSYIKHSQNKNGAAARNTGIRASKGDYIAFLDDDDLFLQGKLAKQKAYLDCHEEYAATYCLAQRGGIPVASFPYKGNLAKELLMMKTAMFTPSLMFRREALYSINGFDESFNRHQDYELLLRFFRKGYLMGCVDEILVEIGLNKGENRLKADRLLQMKQHFLSLFADEIDFYDQQAPGFKRYVYGKHYTAIFSSFLKEHRLGQSTRFFIKAFFSSPKAFWETVMYSIKYHMAI